jgi:hypothetical protein
MIDPRFTSPVSGFLYMSEENEIPISLSGANISLTLCYRTGITDNLGNYFVSLNLPTTENEFPKNSSLSFFYPELQQLNVDKILLIKIPNTAYTEYIDARSIKLNLPGTGTTNPIKFYTTFSSTYTEDFPSKYGETSPLLGDNITYLFSDSVNLPYTGLSINQLGEKVSHSGVTSWNPVSRRYQDRPSAVSYGEIKLDNDTINTDRRYRINKSVFVDGLYNDYRGQAIGYYDTYFSAGNVGFIVLPDRNFFQIGDSVTVDEFKHIINPSYSGNVTITSILKNQTFNNLYYAPKNYNGPFDVIITDLAWVNSSSNEAGTLYISGGTYYNYDIPVGFAVLDKGLIAITHSDIVDSIDWTSGFLPDGTPSDGTVGSGTTNIYFTNTDTSIYGDVEPVCSLDFTSLDTVFKWRATCNSLYGQFYISNNSTWDNSIASNQYSANQPVAITELGLYNEMNELIAVSKFSEPIFKDFSSILTFEVDINL